MPFQLRWNSSVEGTGFANFPGAGEVNSACHAGAALAAGRRSDETRISRTRSNMWLRTAIAGALFTRRQENRIGAGGEHARSVIKTGINAFLVHLERTE